MGMNRIDRGNKGMLIVIGNINAESENSNVFWLDDEANGLFVAEEDGEDFSGFALAA